MNETQQIVDKYRERNGTQQQITDKRFIRAHRQEDGIAHIEHSINGTSTYYVFHDGAKPFHCRCGADSIDECVCDTGYARVELQGDVTHVWPA